MGTSYAEIINDYAMMQIDDIRLREDIAISPARFLRKMALYMKNAIPRFTKPAEAQGWLEHDEPEYDDMTVLAEGEEEPRVIETGKQGYGIACCVYTRDDGYGGMETVPLRSEYDSETGNVTVYGAENGAVIEIDFYKDGEFKNDLDDRAKRILGLCVQYEWERRFLNAFLIQQPKIHDKSFDVGSESNMMRVGNERLRMLHDHLEQEMNAYEQDIYYKNVVMDTGWMKPVRQ